jgi:outer membrane protein OmpA-like peptidoglycan-associated protein
MKHTQATGFAFLAVAMFALPACATKGYVNKQIADVNGKVESVSRTVEETQERTRANEGKINAVDQKAGAAQGAADTARKAAADADAKAGVADAKAVELDRASRKLVYTVTLSADQGDFASGKWELPDAAKARIDELIARVKVEGQPVYFEIEGHTDSTGPKAFNDKLGLDRADAAKKYLHDQYQIPLHKISVISYGADKPVAPNKTKADRAQNRRIVINVLS